MQYNLININSLHFSPHLFTQKVCNFLWDQIIIEVSAHKILRLD